MAKTRCNSDLKRGVYVWQSAHIILSSAVRYQFAFKLGESRHPWRFISPKAAWYFSVAWIPRVNSNVSSEEEAKELEHTDRMELRIGKLECLARLKFGLGSGVACFWKRKRTTGKEVKTFQLAVQRRLFPYSSLGEKFSLPARGCDYTCSNQTIHLFIDIIHVNPEFGSTIDVQKCQTCVRAPLRERGGAQLFCPNKRMEII